MLEKLGEIEAGIVGKMVYPVKTKVDQKAFSEKTNNLPSNFKQEKQDIKFFHKQRRIWVHFWQTGYIHFSVFLKLE